MIIVIIGGGRVGFYLAKTLMQKGHDVTVVERDKNRCMSLQNELGEIIVWGNGSNIKVLAEAGCAMADVVVVATREDDDNLVISQMVKNHFNVSKVISRINNPCNERIFHELGINTTISSISVIAGLIQREEMGQQVKEVLSFKPEQLKVQEIIIKSGSAGAGKQIKNLDLPEGCLLTAIIRDNQVIIPRGDYFLLEGDRIFLLTGAEGILPAI